MKTKYTVNRNYGIGEIVSEDEKYFHVIFEDGTEKQLLKSLVSPLTIEEAEEKIEMWDNAEYNREIESEKIQKEGISAQHKLEEINRKSSLNCRNSSMR